MKKIQTKTNLLHWYGRETLIYDANVIYFPGSLFSIGVVRFNLKVNWNARLQPDIPYRFMPEWRKSEWMKINTTRIYVYNCLIYIMIMHFLRILWIEIQIAKTLLRELGLNIILISQMQCVMPYVVASGEM